MPKVFVKDYNVEIDFPDGMADDEISSILSKQYPVQREAPKGSGSFFGDVPDALSEVPGNVAKAGVRTIQKAGPGAGGALLEYAGHMADKYPTTIVNRPDLEPDSLLGEHAGYFTGPATKTVVPADDTLTRFAKIGGKAAREYWDEAANDPILKTKVDNFTDIKSVADGIRYGSTGVGNLAGSMALIFGTGGMGGGGVGTGAAGVALKEGVKRGLGRRLGGKLLEFATPNPLHAPIAWMEGGEITGKQLENREKTGAELSPERAMAATALATFLEGGVGAEAAFSKFAKMGPAAKEFAKRALATRMLQGGAVTGFEEGSQEFLQSYAENWGGDPSKLWTKETLYEAIDSALQGMAGGHVMGVTGGAGARRQYNDVQAQQKAQQGILMNPVDYNAPNAPRMIENRANIARHLEEYIAETDPALARAWGEHATEAIGANRPIDMSMVTGSNMFDMEDFTDKPGADTAAGPPAEDTAAAPFELTQQDQERAAYKPFIDKLNSAIDAGQISKEDLAGDVRSTMAERYGETHPIVKAIDDLTIKLNLPPGVKDGMDMVNKALGGQPIPMLTSPVDFAYSAKAEDPMAMALEQPGNVTVLRSIYESLTQNNDKAQGITPLLLDSYVREGGLIPSNRPDLAMKYPQAAFEEKYTGAEQTAPATVPDRTRTAEDDIPQTGDFYDFEFKNHPIRGPHKARFHVNKIYAMPDGTLVPLVDDFTNIRGEGLYPILKGSKLAGAKLVKAQEGMKAGFLPLEQEQVKEASQQTAPPPKVKVKPAKTLLRTIIDMGGLSSAKVKAAGFNIKEDFQQHALSFIFRKKGRSLDDVASELISSGVILQSPESISPDSWVLQLLQEESQGKAATIARIEEEINNVDKEIQDVTMSLEETLRSAGYDEESIKRITAESERALLETGGALPERAGSQEVQEDVGERGIDRNETLDDTFVQEVEPTEEIDEAANEAATSPQNDIPEPTEAQIEAGNYKKGHIEIQGLDISIENPKGSVRSGVSKEGKRWESELKAHYGYIRRTEGADGDHVDVFIGDNPASPRVFVVYQTDPSTGKFDEHKVMIGYNSIEEARKGYLENYEPGWQGLGNIVPMSMDSFKNWLAKGPKSAKAPTEDNTLFDTGDTFTLSGNQPFTPQKMKAPEKKGEDRLVDVVKQTTDELRDRLSGEKAKREYEEKKAPARNAEGILSYKYAKRVTDAGYRFIKGDLKEGSEIFKALSGIMTLPYARRLLGSGITAEETAPKEEAGADNKIFTKDRADKAREILRKKLNQMNVGIDPEMLSAGIDLAGYYIEGGARKFADFSKKMVEDLGEKIRPFLKSFYLAVRNYPGMDKTGMETEQELENYKEENPGLTYEEFVKQYRDAFERGKKYTPKQAGFRTYTDKMAVLADDYPEFLERLEAEEEKASMAVPLKDVERVYIERQLAGKKKARDMGENQDVVLTGGPPASGKSTTLEASIENKDKYVVVNADDVRRLAGKETDPEYHEEASRIANVLLQKTLSEGYHVIYDSQLTNLGKADSIIKQALENGGTADIFLLECDDPWETKIRTIVRYMVDQKKGQKKPRYVPDDPIIKGYEYSLPTFIELFERYRDNPSVGFKLVDNSVNMRNAIPVFEKGIGGMYKVYDQALFDKLMNEEYNIYDEGKTAKARRSRPRFTASTLSSGWEAAYDAIQTISKEKHGIEISTGEIQSFRRSYAPDNGIRSERQLEEPSTNTTEGTKEPSIDAANRLADWVKTRLEAGNIFSRSELFSQAAAAFNGTMSEGAYNGKDIFDALELGINKYIDNRQAKTVAVFSPYGAKVKAAQENIDEIRKAIMDKIPSQSGLRSEEQDEFQQFSTPPDLAYTMAWVANISKKDIVLEPSAGIGGIAVFGKMHAKKTIVNELSPRRAAILEEMGFDQVYTENAEQIYNILHKEIKPTVVLMNPPFSSTAGRVKGQRKSGNVIQHLDQALKLLQPNGRMVALIGKGWFADPKVVTDYFQKLRDNYNLRAIITIGGKGYAKYGTTYDNRILVIDKTAPENKTTVQATVEDVRDAIPLLEEIKNARATIIEQQSAEPEGKGISPAGEGTTRPVSSVLSPTGSVGSGERSESGLPGRGKPETNAPVGTGKSNESSGKVKPSEPPGTFQPGEWPEGTERPRVGGTRQASRDVDVEPRADETAEPGLIVEKKTRERSKEELSDSVYESYTPQKVSIVNAKPHPGKLVESAAMSMVDPPDPTYSPKIPESVIKTGQLSLAQLESIVYAGQAHQEMLTTPVLDDNGKPTGKFYRKGYFIGDGTGVGKGREIAGIMRDNYNQGRKKAIWVSQNAPLIEDARRDIKGTGWKPDLIFDMSKAKLSNPLAAKEGIAFLGYDLLKSRDRKNDKVSRLNQLVDWFGKDYDGVIVFDEAHNMGNALAVKGTRGTSKPSAKALAGVELQRLLPNARVVYVSATGATEVMNLSYADRLGLWGEGTPFASKQDFVAQIAAGGIAAMEFVARDMKAMGNYLSRSLSYEDVKYDRLEHNLTPDQREVYDELATAWQGVLARINEALEATGGSHNKNARSATLSAFWGSLQRFFNQIITSMQTPAVVNAIEDDIKNGSAVVIQIVNTNEAAQERALARMEEGDELEDLDLTPRDQLMQYVRNSFPVAQYQEVTDPNDPTKTIWIPVVDSNGAPVENPEAVAMREALLDKLGSIRVPDGPLEIILNHFGHEKVAEITGRTRRVITVDDEQGRHKVIEKRSQAKTMADTDAFMGDKKPILIFSYAGGTGRSYHADLAAKNQRLRRHYLLQAGWRADRAIQGFGRTHRSSQAQAPEYILVTTDVIGQKRFISSIARRLDQLGALTKGQRETGSGGFFTARDNLESVYAQDAIARLIMDIYGHSVPGWDIGTFIQQTGLTRLVDPRDGSLNVEAIPPVTQFLNRLLAMNLDKQVDIFDLFSRRHDANIRAAMANGTLDVGLETLRAKKIQKTSEQIIHTDEKSGAQTKYVQLDITRDAVNYRFNEIPLSWRSGGYYRNVKSGHVWSASASKTQTDARTGELSTVVRLRGPRGAAHEVMLEDLAKADKYEKMSDRQAKSLWDEEYNTLPKEITYQEHFVTGALLPIWDRLSGKARIMRVQTDEGERLIGRLLDPKKLTETLRKLGATTEGKTYIPEDVFAKVKNQGFTVELSNGWKIKRAKVAGEYRIEIVGPDFRHTDELKRHGVFQERVNWETRFFIPTSKEGAKTVKAIIANRPIVNEVAPLSTRENLGTAPSFRKAEPGAKEKGPYKAANLEKLLGPIIANVAKNTGVNVKVIQDNYGFPADFVERAGADFDIKNDKVYGAYDPKTSIIYLVADHAESTSAAEKTLFEELVGHRGLPAFLGNEKTAQLRAKVYTQFKGTPEMQKVIKDYGLNIMKAEDRQAAGNEYMIHNIGRPTVMAQVIAYIREALRRMGFKVRYSDADLRTLVGSLMNKVEASMMGGRRTGTATDSAPAFREQKPAAPFYSQLLNTVERKLNDMPAKVQSVIPWLTKNQVKPMELEEMGVSDWLKENQTDGKIDKTAFAEWVKANQIQVQEVMKGGERSYVDYESLPADMQKLVYDYIDGYLPDGNLAEEAEKLGYDVTFTYDGEIDTITKSGSGIEPAKFTRWTLPGGTNHKELMFIWANAPEGTDYMVPPVHRYNDNKSDRNRLFHVRMQDFIDSEGNKVLLIEEGQSDLHQEGKKEGYQGETIQNIRKKYPALPEDTGSWSHDTLTDAGLSVDEVSKVLDYFYGTEKGVPPAPFRENWHEYIMKRMLRYAAENGYDKLAWTTGEQQAERYDLSKHVDAIEYTKDDENINLVGIKDGEEIFDYDADPDSPKELENYVGKELAEKIINSKSAKGAFSGLDLKVGGKGMKVFYDQLIPGFMNKYVKKWGAKVGETQILGLAEENELGYADEDIIPVPSISITPAMKEAVLYEGQPLYKKENIKRMAEAAMKNPELDISNLTAANSADMVKKGIEYYNDNLLGKRTYSPLFKEYATFDEGGLEHLLENKSIDAQARRLKLLPKIMGVIETARYIDTEDIRSVGENRYRYGLMGRFADGTVVNVVLEEFNKGGKKFLSIYDVDDLKGERLFRKMGVKASDNHPISSGTVSEGHTTIDKEMLSQDKEPVKSDEKPSFSRQKSTDPILSILASKNIERQNKSKEPLGTPTKEIPDPAKDSTKKTASWLNRETAAIFRTIAGGTPGNMPHNSFLENVLKSPEWYEHPVFKNIVRLFTMDRERLYHTAMLDLSTIDDQSVIEETDRLRKKNPSAYKELLFAIDYGDTRWKRGEASMERLRDPNISEEARAAVVANQVKKYEEYLREKRGVSSEAIRVWKLHRASYDKALDMMTAQLRALVAQMEEGGLTEQTKTVLKELRFALASMQEWRGFYAPRLRERASWAVQAEKTVGDKTERYREHKSKYAAERLADKLREEGWKNVTVTEISKLPESVYQNLKAVDVAKAIKDASAGMKGQAAIAFNDELIEHVSNLIKSRGFRSSMIHRGSPEDMGVVKGYMEDPLERYTTYVNNLAGGLSKAQVAQRAMQQLLGERDEDGRLQGGIDAKNEHRVYVTAERYIAEQLRNLDHTDRIVGVAKSIATFKYLGFNPRSAFVNMTAMVTTVPASIHQYVMGGEGSMSKILAEITRAGAEIATVMAAKHKLKDADEQAFIERIQREGYDDPQLTRDAMGKVGKIHKRAWSKIMSVAMWGFGKTEQWNRMSTMLAGYRIARAAGKTAGQAHDLAIDASNKAHGLYGRATLPAWAQGGNPAAKVGQMLYVYGKFGHNYLQMMYDLGFKKHDVKAVLWGFISPLVLAGGSAWPLKDVLTGIIEAILRLFGFKGGAEKFVYDGIRTHLGKKAELGARHGVTGLAGVDISGSLSIGVGIPKNMWELTGAVGGVYDDAAKAFHYLGTGQPGRALEKAMPTGLANPMRAAREATRGVTSESGRPMFDDETGRPLKLNAGQTALRAAGFRPSEQAVQMERKQEHNAVVKGFTNRRNDIYEEARAYFSDPDRDTTGLTRLMKKQTEYNQSIRDAGMVGMVPFIKYSNLKDQARRMNKADKRERMRLRQAQ